MRASKRPRMQTATILKTYENLKSKKFYLQGTSIKMTQISTQILFHVLGVDPVRKMLLTFILLLLP